MDLQVKSLRYLQELAKRKNAVSSGRVIRTRIKVNPDLKWWYWVEFGTAFHGQMGINTPTDHPDGYQIPDVAGSPKVRFPGHDGSYQIRASVHHMGIHPHLMVSAIEDEIQAKLRGTIERWLTEGSYNVSVLDDLIYLGLMPDIVAMIAESFKERLNTGWISGFEGVRSTEDGGHIGQPAYEAFLASAEIVPIT